MIIVRDNITIAELKKLAEQKFGNMVKAVVDIGRNIMALDGELHADEEAFLIENGSEQKNLWGINIYPELKTEERIEFDSMINIKPSQGNRTRSIDDPIVKDRIIKIVTGLIKDELPA